MAGPGRGSVGAGHDFPSPLLLPPAAIAVPPLAQVIDDAAHAAVRTVWTACNGDSALAASKLGISEGYLRRLLERAGYVVRQGGAGGAT